MNDPEEPISRDITQGIPRDMIAAMTADQREAVVRLMARAAEAAYRRGAQQGVMLTANRPDDMRTDLHDWRYGLSLDDAPWLDDCRKETSVSRLFIEHGDLRSFGLGFPMSEAIMPDFRMDDTYQPRGGGKH
jgi:hypothetical protein